MHDEATEASVAAAGASYQGIDFVTDVRPPLPIRFSYLRYVNRHFDTRK